MDNGLKDYWSHSGHTVMAYILTVVIKMERSWYVWDTFKGEETDALDRGGGVMTMKERGKLTSMLRFLARPLRLTIGSQVGLNYKFKRWRLEGEKSKKLGWIHVREYLK